MVEFETRGRVAVLTINRPEARNAVNAEVAQAMEAGIDRLEDDPELWAGVVAGTGPVFSAGADLKVIASGRPQDLLTERGGFGGTTRRVVLGSAGEGDEVGWRLTDEAFAEIIRSEDFAEGPRAFVEKRPPEWKGR